MNKLPQVDADAWRLARHAHVVVYEARDGGELLTIYDCGAAQAPPKAQIVGHLVRTTADHETEQQPTGHIVKLQEEAVLRCQGDDHYVIEAA
ncbi:MAG: hypothetical protein ABEJ88_06305 [Halobacterium sp.]